MANNKTDTKATVGNHLCERISSLKEVCGIDEANCETCDYGHPQYDGDHGMKYLGISCRKIRESTGRWYVEDAGLDIRTEKDCWEPCFVASKFAGLYGVTKEGNDKAMRRFEDAALGVNKRYMAFIDAAVT